MQFDRFYCEIQQKGMVQHGQKVETDTDTQENPVACKARL